MVSSVVAYFAETVWRLWTAVYEGRRNDRQTAVDRVRLTNVEDKLRILYHVYPEPQRQTTHTVHTDTQALNASIVLLTRVMNDTDTVAKWLTI